ncbi:EF-hand [Cystobasidium minutum MCA 4210]|uniref:EF-hand n=1 Tax=Cystobasidium minutum MCA 4210 TaxID=1397322 RepID=UPI0034CEA80D|eukprot:jgi/Rhomi1/57805/CE57804_147
MPYSSSLDIGHGRPGQGKGRMSHPRVPSESLYNAFDPEQIKQFKEAFTMIDQDSDGLVDEKDLGKLLQQLGFNPSSQVIASYFDATPSKNRSINFTTFLTMFSDHLLSMDPEDELSEAFAAFDETDSGYVPVSQMRVFLSSLGDRMTEEEISRFLSPPFTDKHGNFNYRQFLKSVRVIDQEQQQQQQQQQGKQ